MHIIQASVISLFIGSLFVSTEEPRTPYVLILGTAQDGGLPQLACTCGHCQAARADSKRARHIASLLIVDPERGRRWLIDATPHLRRQYDLAAQLGAVLPPSQGRPPLFDGIFLTHAHTGHYLGLAQLGRPAYNAQGQLVYASQRMCRYLASNGPWKLLVGNKNLILRPVEPGTAVDLGSGLKVTPMLVPHRAEFTDTFAYLIEGPTKRLIYIPDIDKWERWDVRIEDRIHDVDYALIDGTFFADGEVPGRKMSEISHPFVIESLRRFAKLPRAERNKIWFTHLNHTNPLVDSASDASKRVRQAGFHVARDGDQLKL